MSISNDDLQYYINQAKAAGFSDFIINRFIANNGPDDIRRWDSALSPENDPYFGDSSLHTLGAPVTQALYATPTPQGSATALAASPSTSGGLITGSLSGLQLAAAPVSVGATTVNTPGIPWIWIGVAVLGAYLLFRKER